MPTINTQDNTCEGWRNHATFHAQQMMRCNDSATNAYYSLLTQECLKLQHPVERLAKAIEDRLQEQYETLHNYLSNNRRIANIFNTTTPGIENRKPSEDEIFIHTQAMQDNINEIDFIEIAQEFIRRYKESKS